MARRKAKKIRYDSCGRVLNKGESQRPDGRYMFQWTDDITGKRMTVYADTLQALRKEEKRIEADARDGIRADAAEVTVNALFDYMMKQKKGLKENTRITYLQTYNLYCRDGIGKRKVQEVRPMEIEGLFSSIMDDGKSGNTLALVNSCLNPIFKIAVQNDICRKNPCEGMLTNVVKNHGWQQDKKTAVSEKDISRFMAFAKTRSWCAGEGFLPAIKVMLLTGCRVSEVLGLIPSDIDFTNRIITIRRELIRLKKTESNPSRYVVTEPKSAAGKRIVPMSDDCAAAIREAMAFRMKHGSISTVDGVSGFLFVTKCGTVQNYHAVNNYIRDTVNAFNKSETEAAEQENREPDLMEQFSCHKLRHSFAARSVENDINPKLLQSVLGHSSFSTTMDIYAEFRDEKKAEAFEEIRKIASLA